MPDAEMTEAEFEALQAKAAETSGGLTDLGPDTSKTLNPIYDAGKLLAEAAGSKRKRTRDKAARIASELHALWDQVKADRDVASLEAKLADAKRRARGASNSDDEAADD